MDAATVFRALSDETRRRILQLVLKQELSVSELVACLGQPQSTVSRHLKVLRDASLIRDRREGTTVLYTAPDVHRHGAASGLQDRILDWLAHEELGSVLEDRLRRVLADRQHRSSSFFAGVSDRWDQMRIDAFGSAFHLEAMVRLLPREWVVADIGTGTGFLLPMLGDAFQRVIAIDPVEEMLDAARTHAESGGHRNITFRQGDLSRLPISDASVDLVVAILVLHHVPSVGEAISEIGRVLRPDGKVLIVEQKAHDLLDFQERMQDRWTGFEPDELERIVRGAGFLDAQVAALPVSSQGSGKFEAPELFTMIAGRSSGQAGDAEIESKNRGYQSPAPGNSANAITMEID